MVSYIILKELKELAALAYRDTTAENREFWKNEMGQALREIHQIYDDKMDGMRGELETFYNLKVSIILNDFFSVISQCTYMAIYTVIQSLISAVVVMRRSRTASCRAG